jgi:hypothetical protein
MFGGALESQLTPKNATRHITYRRPGHLHLTISTPKVLNHREISTTTRGASPLPTSQRPTIRWPPVALPSSSIAKVPPSSHSSFCYWPG